MKKSRMIKINIILLMAVIALISVIISISIGTIKFSISDVFKGLFIDDNSIRRIIIFNTRLPRVLVASCVGVALSLSGCILQGVMKNNLASPSTIGVTSGASFVGYLTLVVFPSLSYLLPIGSILGAFFTTMFIYLLAYQKGVSPVKMILSGLAVSALFGAFNDLIKTFFAQDLGNVSSFLVGSLNGTTWKSFWLILPYIIIGLTFCLFIPVKMNILMLGDESARSLGLRIELFRFVLIIISSLLAGSAIAVAGLISFVGLIVPHIARLLVGSDYKYLFPASVFLSVSLMVICDTIGRLIMPPGEVAVSIILAFIGAPFFLFLLRSKK